MKVSEYVHDPEIQKIMRKKWRETPKQTRDNIKKSNTSACSLTRQRR